ncbi:MAG: phage head closure protein [Aestuariivirga sp.]
MDAGKLDRRITLQRSTTSKDEFGQPIETFGTLAQCRASYRPVSDAERQRTNETLATLVARFQVRWFTAIADLNAKDRLLFDGRTFDILNVKEIGRHKGLEISAATHGD